MKRLSVFFVSLWVCAASAQEYNAYNISQAVPLFGGSQLSDTGHIGGGTFGSRGRNPAAIINGTLNVYPSPRGTGRGLDINNQGTLLGYHDESNPVGAYWTSDGTYHPIPLLPGGTSSIGLTIEDDGTIAGIADGPDGPQMAIWRNGEIETFGWIPTRWNAGVRDYGGGKFIGDLYGTVEGDLQGSFIFDTVTRRLTTYSTHSDDGPFTMLWDINNLGQAVGEQSLGLGNGYGGVLIDDSGSTSFGTGFKPSSISDVGVMTGDNEDYQDRLIYRDGVIERIDDLLPPGWDVRELYEINRSGKMLVSASLNGAPRENLLLTPVPEPGTLAAFLVGGAWILRRRVGKPGNP